MCVQKLFGINFNVNSIYLQLICLKMNVDVFKQEMQKSTTYGACDSSSCLWRFVGGIVVKRLKKDREVWTSLGLRKSWRTIVAMTTVVMIKEVVPVPKFQVFKCYGTETLDGPLCLWLFIIPLVEGSEERSRRICIVWDDGVHDVPSWQRRAVARSVDPAAFDRFSANRVLLCFGFLFFINSSKKPPFWD